MRNIAQLDALRGVAILFVLINHTLPQSHLLFKLSDKVSGPDIFFTISGFLITALLLRTVRRWLHSASSSPGSLSTS
jgi:peptidoglycan/LPS O-acetylase OafA/YrhL